MKAVLISVKPKYCQLIANGRKTIEIRKTVPFKGHHKTSNGKCSEFLTPFKCYIYCSKSNGNDVNNLLEIHSPSGKIFKANGTVIGEFVCNKITSYEAELWDDNTFERIQEVYEPDDFIEYGEYEYKTVASNDNTNWKDNILCQESCLSIEELRKFIGTGINSFYGWHISELKIYDKPKELSEFYKQGKCPYNKDGCTYKYHCFRSGETNRCGEKVEKPPKSWMYVEEI